jgi:adenosylcobinamide amidohydrolase
MHYSVLETAPDQGRLPAGACLDPAPGHVHIGLPRPWTVLSSAVLNGGLVSARHLLNYKVPKDAAAACAEPETTLRDYARRQGWQGGIVGMMTAASMGSLRVAQDAGQGIELAVLVTSGLGNLRRTGDRAEHRRIDPDPPPAGTINILCLTSACLTPAALAEALMIMTEAKTAVLHDLELRSPVSGALATGTGTDALAMACDPGGPLLRYCGKHVLFGERLGRLVMQAVHCSVTRQQASPPAAAHLP